MKRKIGCLHAHYSNIAYIEQALSLCEIECIHFVDPGLMYHRTLDEVILRNKVKEQLEWIASCNVDSIIITCTDYIAILGEPDFLPVPIIKIDEPFFAEICAIQQQQTMFFTNPATVSGTVERLHLYAKQVKACIDVEIILIDHAFDLLMQGQIEVYNSEVMKSLKQASDRKIVSVAQLSMVDAAKKMEKKNVTSIINPLDSLVSYIHKNLS
ncbi:hypothetical protein [Ectobacillus sp. sgz5001026]|uniref:hypothetical protein n=1 Tax=Ectobacillus sp. sgz5001026 TaxID=3242473 RepID=UPI0036D314DC